MWSHYVELSRKGHQGTVHNSFLAFWLDQGLIGLVLFLRSYFLIFMKGAQKTKMAYPIMFSIAFTGFFESWLMGSLSAYSFLGMFIFTIITSEEILRKITPQENLLPDK